MPGRCLPASGVLPRFVLLAGVVLCWLFLSRPAAAYPWMIKHGYTNCAACHADPSGGELLTPYGHGISWEALSTHWGGGGEASLREQRAVAALARAAMAKNAPSKVDAEDVNLDDDSGSKADAADKAEKPKKGDTDGEDSATEDSSDSEEKPSESKAQESQASSAAEPSPYEGMGPLVGPLYGLMSPNENFLLGGSLRMASTLAPKVRFFPMQIDGYGQARFFNHLRVAGSIGIIKVPAGSPHGRAAQVTTNQGDQYNMLSRTHWLGWEFGDGQHLFRVGRLNLPFGVRMSEHTMWIREKTQTDRESDQQHGAALYLGWDNVRLEVMGIAGNYQISEQFRERGYSGYVEFVVADKTTVGLNSLYTYAKNDRIYPEGLKTARQAHGAFMRMGPSKYVALLAEADLLARSRRSLGYVAFLTVDTEPVQGLHAMLTGEVLDVGFPKNGGPGEIPRSPGMGRAGLGGWASAQWFFLPHFDVRVDAMFRTDTEVLVQLHSYL